MKKNVSGGTYKTYESPNPLNLTSKSVQAKHGLLWGQRLMAGPNTLPDTHGA